MDNQFQQSRFKDAPWIPQNNESVFIGGAGGIGSWVSFFLARIGFSVIVHDFDIIEEHNTGGQLFRNSDIGQTKVEALFDIIHNYCGDDISTAVERVDLNTPTHWYMISAFDNMKARKDMFEVWERSWTLAPEGVTPVFIDGRLELEQLQIFCVTPSRAEEYREHLFDDSRVEEAPCSMKQSSHTAAMIASHMTAFFTNHIANTNEGMKIRSLPLYYEFVTPMTLTVMKR
jgi:hypothetical protein